MFNYPDRGRANNGELQWLEDSIHDISCTAVTSIGILLWCLLSFITCGDIDRRK